MAGGGRQMATRIGVIAAVLSLLAAGPAAAGDECQPVPLGGSDWGAAVAQREAGCAPVQAAPRPMMPNRMMPDRQPGMVPMPMPPRIPPPPPVIAIYDARVQFAFDSADLLPAAMPALAELANFLLSGPGRHRFVRVEGHTDAIGSDAYNLGLSQRRAEMVRAYLLGRGVPATRMQAVGFGRLAPLPQTSPYDGVNRRVQFRFAPLP